MNRTVVELLKQALGQSAGRPYDNGLGALAGGWSESDLETFERAVDPFEQVDPELWTDP